MLTCFYLFLQKVLVDQVDQEVLQVPLILILLLLRPNLVVLTGLEVPDFLDDRGPLVLL